MCVSTYASIAQALISMSLSSFSRKCAKTQRNPLQKWLIQQLLLLSHPTACGPRCAVSAVACQACHASGFLQVSVTLVMRSTLNRSERKSRISVSFACERQCTAKSACIERMMDNGRPRSKTFLFSKNTAKACLKTNRKMCLRKLRPEIPILKTFLHERILTVSFSHLKKGRVFLILHCKKDEIFFCHYIIE